MERRFLIYGIVLTVVVHGAFAALLIASAPKSPFCEDGLRCETPVMVISRRPAEIPADLLTDIEASIVPRLGLAKQNPHRYPRLYKYEQPKKVEVAVNISHKVKKPKVLPKAEKKKKAQLDKRRRKRHKKLSLSDILNAPDDNDKRKRPSMLDRIVGSPNGSVYSDAAVARKGNLYAARVGLSIRRVFKTPALLSPGVLRHLKVRIMVTKIDKDGHILGFKVIRKSGNASFDRAAKAAVIQFVPSMGGRKTLPKPDPMIMQLINKKGMIIDLEGKRLIH